MVNKVEKNILMFHIKIMNRNVFLLLERENIKQLSSVMLICQIRISLMFASNKTKYI